MRIEICQVCGARFLCGRYRRKTCGESCRVKALSVYRKKACQTLEGKVQIREANKCAQRELIGKPNPCRAGVLSNFWKGGITLEAQCLRNKHQSELRTWREKVYTRDNYICRLCDERGGRLNAHHILSFALYPEYRFDVDNGVTLCRSCHSVLEGHLRCEHIIWLKINRLLGVHKLLNC